MSLNASKTKSINISICLEISSTEHQTIYKTEIQVSEFKLLGVTVDRHLSFAAHVKNVFKKSRSKLHALLILKRHGVSTEGLVPSYQVNITSGIIYAYWCISFVLNMATSETHRPKHPLPVGQSGIWRHSSCSKDAPKTPSNYNTTKKNLFSHYAVAETNSWMFFFYHRPIFWKF